MLKMNIRKVSVIALPLKNTACLNTNEVKNPKIRPTVSETVPSIRNCPKITNGV